MSSATKTVDWEDFLSDQLLDLSTALELLNDAAEDPVPEGYMLKVMQQVLSVHPHLAGIVIPRYAHLLTQNELSELARQFESVERFVSDYAQEIAILIA